MNKTWKTILTLIGAIASAILGALGAQAANFTLF